MGRPPRHSAYRNRLLPFVLALGMTSPGLAIEPAMLPPLPDAVADRSVRETRPAKDISPPPLVRVPASQPTLLAPADRLASNAEASMPDSAPEPAVWREPTELINRLTDLSEQKPTAAWAAHVLSLVARLGTAVQQNSHRARPLLDDLVRSETQAAPLADSLADVDLARRLRRAAYALRRRLGVWRAIYQCGALGTLPASAMPDDPAMLSLALAEVDTLLGDSAAGDSWREYLDLTSIQDWLDARQPDEAAPPQSLSTEVLQRFVRPGMDSRQWEFVSRKPLRALHSRLWSSLAAPAKLGSLLEDLEAYEESLDTAAAAQLAADCAALVISPDAEQRRLGHWLRCHYRNANIRIMADRSLFTRLIPEKEPENAPVRDVILGVPVRGRSTMWTTVDVRLVPDDEHVHVELSISGEVASLTSSTSGPATFVNSGYTVYEARKPILFDLAGIHTEAAEVDVHNRTQVRSLSTRFDNVPVLGGVVRGVARNEQQRRKPQFEQEIRRKVARQVRERVDAESEQQFEEVTTRWREKVVEPLEGFALDPVLVDATTEEQQIALRVRIAGADQLGSHTPRVQTPPGSLAGVQVHQSAINNALARLDLAGRKFTLAELATHIAEKLDRDETLWESNPDLDDLTLTFADEDPIFVRFDHDRVFVTLSLARLQRGKQSWSDFQARALYMPKSDGASAKLVREGVVRLLGRRISTSGQIALRGVFAQVFSRRRAVKLTPQTFLDHPKLSDLAVGQFSTDDGWLSLAWSAERTAEQPDETVQR